MNCVSCGQDRPIAARGLCRTCYSRWQRTGDVVRINDKRGTVCSVEGCNARVHGQGLCNKHLLRLRRSGSVENARVYTHRQKDLAKLPTTHDLYPVWAEFRRARNPRPVDPRWRDNFETFVAEVRPRPGRRFRLYGIDRSKPLGPDNYEWREASVEKQPGESQREYARRQQREHRKMYPASYAHNSFMRLYGISFEDYSQKAEEQDNCCAICGQRESDRDANGKVKALAVDHDHATGQIRGLLCQACNTGLGKFKDDPLVLAKAIAYLARHATIPVPAVAE